MKFVDLDIQSNLSSDITAGQNSAAKGSTVEEIAKFAEQLGFSSIVICDVWQGSAKLRELKEKIAEAQKIVKIEILPGAKIAAQNVGDLKRALEQVREQVVVIAVAGGDYDINRAACEDSRVDFLAHPEFGRRDNGLDEACLNAASKNNVAIEINFRELLGTYRKNRAIMLEKIGTNVRLCQELGVKMVVSSGAQSVWEIRDPRELVSIANILGMELATSFATVADIPSWIVERNKQKLAGKIVADGIEIVNVTERSEAIDKITETRSGSAKDDITVSQSEAAKGNDDITEVRSTLAKDSEKGEQK